VGEAVPALRLRDGLIGRIVTEISCYVVWAVPREATNVIAVID
jgi:hypothetical protein